MESQSIRHTNIRGHTILAGEEDRGPLPTRHGRSTPHVRAADEDGLTELMLVLIGNKDVVSASAISVPLEAACLHSSGF